MTMTAPTGGTQEPITAPAPAPQTNAASQSFTQEDLSAIAAKTREEGRKAETARILKELGVEDLDQAKAALKAKQDADDAAKTEAQRLNDALTAQQAENARIKSELVATKVTTALDGALRDSKINPARLTQAVKLADLSGVEVKDGVVAGLEGVVAQLRSVAPEWFTGQTAAPETGSTSGTQDYRTASPEEVQKALRRYNLK
jgi:hypothetical protein